MSNDWTHTFEVKAIQGLDVEQLVQLRHTLLSECHGRFRTVSANPGLLRRVQLRQSDSFTFVGDRRIHMRIPTDRVQFIDDSMRPYLDEDMDLIEVHAILCGHGNGKPQPFHVDKSEYGDSRGKIVQVPLQYTDSNNGQTEFVVGGGHIDSPPTRLGEVIIMQLNTRHRGVPNRGNEARVMVQLLYYEKGTVPRKWEHDFYYHATPTRRFKSRVFDVSSVDPLFYESHATRKRLSETTL